MAKTHKTIRTGLLTGSNKPKYIFVHVSATSDTPGNPEYDKGEDMINNIHKYMFRPSCEDGVLMHTGYHYIIKKDGTVEKGKADSHMGQQTGGFNQKSLGICCIGNGNGRLRSNKFYDSVDGPFSFMPQAQLNALASLIKRLVAENGIKTSKILGHHDSYMLPGRPKIMEKPCPNFSLTKFVTGGCLDSPTLVNYQSGTYAEHERAHI